jgi:hypothetical protein
MYSSRMAYILSILYLKSYSQYYNNTFLIKPFNIFSSYIRRRIFILLLAEIESFFHDVDYINNHTQYLMIDNTDSLNNLLFEILKKIINKVFVLNYSLNKAQLTSWWLTQKFIIENEKFLVCIKIYLRQINFPYTEINYLLETIIFNLMDYISKFFLYTIFTNKNFEFDGKQNRLNVCYYLLVNDLLTYYLSMIRYSYFNKYTLFIFTYNGKIKYKHIYDYNNIYKFYSINSIIYIPLLIFILLLLVYNILNYLTLFKRHFRQNKNQILS